MRNRTEDLLRVRDGEPVNAELGRRLAADPDARAELERLRTLKGELASLPPVEPPAALARKVIEAMAGARKPARAGHRWAAALVVAALALGAVGTVAYKLGEAGDAASRAAAAERATPPADAGGSISAEPRTAEALSPTPLRLGAGSQIVASAATDPGARWPFDDAFAAAGGQGRIAIEPAYFPLVQESARLERVLARLPAPRRVIRGGTAGTIAGLEGQIALIDDRLALGAAEGLDPAYGRALWQERVDVMNALVQVRYAQSSAFWY